jgi:hypothetical protein
VCFLLQAASLLKKTEGVVSLVVCNPNKVKEDEKKAAEAEANVSSSLSAPQSSAAAVLPSPKEPEKPSESHITMFHSLWFVGLFCCFVNYKILNMYIELQCIL